MAVSYKKLFHLMIDNGMTNAETTQIDIRKAPTVSDRCFNAQFLRIFIFEIRN